MDIEDVIAIARGRRKARTQRVKPRAAIEDIAQSLLPVPVATSDASGVTSDHLEVTSSAHTSGSQPLPVNVVDKHVSVADTAKAHAKISRWVDQMYASPSAASSSPKECLIQFAQEDRTRISLVLDITLGRELEIFSQVAHVRLEKQYPSQHRHSPGWCHNLDSCAAHLRTLHDYSPSLRLINSPETLQSCLRILDHWQFLLRVDAQASANLLVDGQPWKPFERKVLYIAYLGDYGVVERTIFASFWTTLKSRFRSALLSAQKVNFSRTVKGLMESSKSFVSCKEVSMEMDTLYQTLEEARSEAQYATDDPHASELGQILDVRRLAGIDDLFADKLSRTSSKLGYGLSDRCHRD
jgi:hypothetical protein